MESDPRDTMELEGELLSPTLQMIWIETGREIAKGSLIVPVTISASTETVEHAALHLAADDLKLAQESFSEAMKLGLPSDKNNLSKALINAAVMAYARSFAGGVRGFRLTEEFFSDVWAKDDIEFHSYLYALRDKHIAHSVNDFEQATTVGIVVTDPSLNLLGTNPSGVGVAKLSMVGLPMSKLRNCARHIDRMISKIDTRISELNYIVHEILLRQMKVGETVEPAPMVRLSDRSRIADRRPQ